MKKSSKKKEVLISGIAVVVLLIGGLILAICVAPNPFEKFLYDTTGVMGDINGDGIAALIHVRQPKHLADDFGNYDYEGFVD